MNILNRLTKEYIIDVTTTFYPVDRWIIDPILPLCHPDEWVIEGDKVRETTQKEKDDRATLAAAEQKKIDDAAQIKKDNDTITATTDKATFMALSVDDKLEYLYDRK